MNFMQDYYHFNCENLSQFNNLCESFISKLKVALDNYFPLKSIVLNSTEPTFMNAGIKHLLHIWNSRMHCGRISTADKITEQIRSIIIHNNSQSFSNVNTRVDSRKAWCQINRLLNKVKCSSEAGTNNINANDMNSYYADISSDRNWQNPSHRFFYLFYLYSNVYMVPRYPNTE